MDARSFLPSDHEQAALVGRVLDPEIGPCVVAVRGDLVADITSSFPTMSDLLEAEDPTSSARSAHASRTWPLEAIIGASIDQVSTEPRLVAPVDLSVIKATGVSFAASLLERVLEERAGGNPDEASRLRADLEATIGNELSSVVPGSPQAAQLAESLKRQGMWSAYLEVGIGPDPEIFTKAPVLSSVGLGQDIGVARVSSWNNPEPEVVLAVSSRGRVVGATLGNDVNLRDIEGRSALLLGRAKDNNAACAIGPFVRLFDDGFDLHDVEETLVELEIIGAQDGFKLIASSSMSQISRSPADLVGHVVSPDHHYPDGVFLFLGTMFAPTQDRDELGRGFTHHVGDIVRIHSRALGTLQNTVTYSDEAPPWSFGIRDLIQSLVNRNLVRQTKT